MTEEFEKKGITKQQKAKLREEYKKLVSISTNLEIKLQRLYRVSKTNQEIDLQIEELKKSLQTNDITDQKINKWDEQKNTYTTQYNKLTKELQNLEKLPYSSENVRKKSQLKIKIQKLRKDNNQLNNKVFVKKYNSTGDKASDFFLSEIENFKAYLEENLMINLIVY